MKKITIVAAFAALAISASPRQAKAQQYLTCDNALSSFCMGWEIVSGTGANPFKVNVWDASAVGTNGRFVSFGFWGLGTSLTLANVRYFDGTSLSGNLASKGDWTDGPNNGYGITGYSAAAGIANNEGDGFTLDPKPANTSCNAATSGGGGAYGQDCWLTGGSMQKYLQFEFSGTPTFTAGGVSAGFRVQNTGASGDGSYKCGEGVTAYSCTTTISTVPEPSTYLLMATGLLGLGIAARRRRRV